MPPPLELRLILTTFAREADATSVIRALLDERLVACGTLLHRARSIYLWKGEIEDSEEVVVILKTTSAAEAMARLKDLHPYETPEILAFAPEAFDAAYARWVGESCSSH